MTKSAMAPGAASEFPPRRRFIIIIAVVVAIIIIAVVVAVISIVVSIIAITTVIIIISHRRRRLSIIIIVRQRRHRHHRGLRRCFGGDGRGMEAGRAEGGRRGEGRGGAGRDGRRRGGERRARAGGGGRGEQGHRHGVVAMVIVICGHRQPFWPSSRFSRLVSPPRLRRPRRAKEPARQRRASRQRRSQSARALRPLARRLSLRPPKTTSPERVECVERHNPIWDVLRDKFQVRTLPDFLKRICDKHGGEARLIDWRWVPMPMDVDVGHPAFWSPQFARSQASRQWLANRAEPLRPLSPEDIDWVLDDEGDGKTLLIRGECEAAPGASRFAIRSGTVVTLAQMFYYYGEPKCTAFVLTFTSCTWTCQSSSTSPSARAGQAASRGAVWRLLTCPWRWRNSSVFFLGGGGGVPFFGEMERLRQAGATLRARFQAQLPQRPLRIH